MTKENFMFHDPPQSWIHEYAMIESSASSSFANAGAGGLGSASTA